MCLVVIALHIPTSLRHTLHLMYIMGAHAIRAPVIQYAAQNLLPVPVRKQ